MKALVWTGPRSMEMRDVERPALTAGEVLLQVQKAGICGSELSGYLGENSLRKPPLIMGHEFSAVIVEAAADVGEVVLGQLVTHH